jgi:hypothetical protein
MESILIIHGISALAIILGFIALLTQKIYMDAKTQKATQIKIPIVGRLTLKSQCTWEFCESQKILGGTEVFSPTPLHPSPVKYGGKRR